MAYFEKIYNFNNQLLKSNKKETFSNYLTNIYNTYLYFIPLHFIKYYKQLYYSKHEFILGLNILHQYNILKKNKKQYIKYIYKFLNLLNLKENVDYIVYIKNSSNLTNKYKIIDIKLTPKAFKNCILYSNDANNYIYYLSLLDQIKYHYNMYIILHNKKYSIIKKINELIYDTNNSIYNID